MSAGAGRMGEEEFVKMNTPMTDAEIRDFLGATMHGPPPMPTLMRIFATLAEVPALREPSDKGGFSAIKWCEMLREKDEALDALRAERDAAVERSQRWRKEARDHGDGIVARCAAAESRSSRADELLGEALFKVSCGSGPHPAKECHGCALEERIEDHLDAHRKGGS